MAAFSAEEIDWRRPDVMALLRSSGLLSVPLAELSALRAWLTNHGYNQVSLKCDEPFVAVLKQIGTLFRWEEEFGYSLEDGQGNLNAIRDGFEFAIEERSGTALVLEHVDDLASADLDWLLGLLAIASEHSIDQLARGARFITVLPLNPVSTLAGALVEQTLVPHPYPLQLP